MDFSWLNSSWWFGIWTGVALVCTFVAGVNLVNLRCIRENQKKIEAEQKSIEARQQFLLGVSHGTAERLTGKPLMSWRELPPEMQQMVREAMEALIKEMDAERPSKLH